MQPVPHPSTPQIPRDAASVVLLRDTPTGIETLLLRRHAQMANMGGLYVFPGGKLDAADREGAALLDQPAQTLHEGLGESALDPATAAGLHVAALREALEECGLLLAEPAQAQAPVDAPRARAMLREGQPLAQVLAALQLRLSTRRMCAWSRWITPVTPAMATRRFDTRFFVAQAPDGQEAGHDDEETTASVWIAPRTALEQYRDGLIDLAPPQIMSLAHLARHASVRSVMEQARLRRPPTILPESFEHDGARVVCYPGDPLHPVRDRALPGPTRMYQRERRFLPENGFDALFA